MPPEIRTVQFNDEVSPQAGLQVTAPRSASPACGMCSRVAASVVYVGLC